ncbi:MAG: YdeI/OmpD-associated family protein [Phycisphaerales bacterium]|nr:YdeI/OmpD-associated family protein [Phycisphaerales bacterium]MCB9862800.1 YdeI/OmpD-associated family protein [Phycisphaerales bacterium]
MAIRRTKTPIRFFRSPAAFRAWLTKNHKTADELIVGFYKKHTGKPSMTWPESVAEALCFGWIDGIRRRVDDESYSIRFTPRRKGSVWSAINVKMMAELEAAGKMTHAGRAIFAARPDPTHPGYSYEARDSDLDAKRLREFKKNKAAWGFFSSQAPSYQRTARHWVMSAKRDETRDRRLAKLIETSAAGRRVYG